MSFLSTMFFILTPFGFFCTENGTGLITGTVFLLLGFLFRWIADGGIERANAPKVSSETFWRTHFTNRYSDFKKSIKSQRENFYYTEEAKSWADAVTRANGGIPPSDERFEEIAKELGVETRKAHEKKMENNAFDALAVLAIIDGVKERIQNNLKSEQLNEKVTTNVIYKEIVGMLQKTISKTFSRKLWLNLSEVERNGGKDELLKKIPEERAKYLCEWEERLKEIWEIDVLKRAYKISDEHLKELEIWMEELKKRYS